MLKTVVGLSEVGNYLRHLGSFLHRYAWASTSRSPSIGPFEASSLIFQELYLRTVSKCSQVTVVGFGCVAPVLGRGAGEPVRSFRPVQTALHARSIALSDRLVLCAGS